MDIEVLTLALTGFMLTTLFRARVRPEDKGLLPAELSHDGREACFAKGGGV